MDFDFPKDGFPNEGLSDHGLSDHGLSDHGLSDHGLSDHGLHDLNIADGFWDAPPTDTGLGAAPSKKKKRNVSNKTCLCKYCFRTLHYFGRGRHEKCCLQNPNSENTTPSTSTVIGLNEKPIRLFSVPSRQPGHKWCPHCTYYHSVSQQPFCPKNK